MVPNVNRRSFAVGVVGLVGTSLLGISSYNWLQYSRLHSTRHHLRFRRLRGLNLSDEPVTLHVTVYEDGSLFYSEEYDFAASADEQGEDDKPMNGPYIKDAGEYSIRIETEDDEMVIGHTDIIDRLDHVSCQGSDDAEVKIIITEDRSLQSEISNSP